MHVYWTSGCSDLDNLSPVYTCILCSAVFVVCPECVGRLCVYCKHKELRDWVTFSASIHENCNSDEKYYHSYAQ